MSYSSLTSQAVLSDENVNTSNFRAPSLHLQANDRYIHSSTQAHTHNINRYLNSKPINYNNIKLNDDLSFAFKSLSVQESTKIPTKKIPINAIINHKIFLDLPLNPSSKLKCFKNRNVRNMSKNADRFIPNRQHSNPDLFSFISPKKLEWKIHQNFIQPKEELHSQQILSLLSLTSKRKSTQARNKNLSISAQNYKKRS